jgi:hypothetical protein
MKYNTKTLPDPPGLIRPHVAPTSGFFFMLRSNSFKAFGTKSISPSIDII